MQSAIPLADLTAELYSAAAESVPGLDVPRWRELSRRRGTVVSVGEVPLGDLDQLARALAAQLTADSTPEAAGSLVRYSMAALYVARVAAGVVPALDSRQPLVARLETLHRVLRQAAAELELLSDDVRWHGAGVACRLIGERTRPRDDQHWSGNPVGSVAAAQVDAIALDKGLRLPGGAAQ